MTPKLSFIIATPQHFSIIRKTVEHVQRQTIRDHIELVIVTASAETLELDSQVVDGFYSVQVVPIGYVESVAHANAAGVRCANAPIIVFGEDHCFPEPTWAEFLLAAYTHDRIVAVGPMVLNGNPSSLTGRADYLISYARWGHPSLRGDSDILPGHNSSYRRDTLIALGETLADDLQAETVLHWQLRERGYRLFVETAAVTHHMNYSLPRFFLEATFYAGRIFGGSRADGWSAMRRSVYTAGSLLIPFVRFRRIIGYARRNQTGDTKTGVLLMLFLGLQMSALGEMIGYAFGSGDADAKMKTFEFDRRRQIRPQERWI